MKKYLLPLLILSFNAAFAQLSETFADGDLVTNPAWNGSHASGDFTIISGRLRSNSATINSNFYLSTASTSAASCTWEFWCNLQFSTSGSNYTDVYLMSDQADLQSTNIHGYFVRIGNTDDEISLYKRTGAKSTSVKIIDGINGAVGASNNTVRIKVTRTPANVFTLERDLTGIGTSYFTEGSITDSEITASAYFGIFVQQSTATFHQKHFFDDFSITPLITDSDPPRLVSARAVDSITVEAVFNEPIDSITAMLPANYMLSDLDSPASVTSVNAFTYRLHYNRSLQTNTYTLTASYIKDVNGNIIAGNNSAQFNFIKPYVAKKNDVVINEIFADPSPQIDLPGLEFVELWNTSGKTINLKNWTYSDANTIFTFANDSIQPDEFLILCARADTAEFKRFGRVLGISPWPALNNSSDHIKLVSDKSIAISEISYTDTWYKDPLKKLGGYTLERIDPLSKCEGMFNWASSSDLSGGTPGSINSSYQKDYDMIDLRADSIQLMSDTTLRIYFNKPLDQYTVTEEKFSITPAFANLKLISLDTEAKRITLTYPQKFTAATTFDLSVGQLRDCSGKELTDSAHLAFTTAADPPVPPVKPDTAHIFITEIFADPSPEIGLPLAEFIELYNPGRDTVDLDGWSINDPTTKAIIRGSFIPPKAHLILCPVADTTEYKAFGKVIGLSPWPALSNASDQITIKSFRSRLVDSIAYSDTWYKNAGKKSGGWSLERIDPLSKCDGITAWTASEDIAGGTPGKINSVHYEGIDMLDLHADSLQKLSDSTLTVFFNKIPDRTSVTPEKFILTPASGEIKNAALSTELNRVLLTFSQAFKPATIYSLTIGSIKDCTGKEISHKDEPLRFTTPALPPRPPIRPDTSAIIINEIFADPSPEVGLPLAEFVEIYNPGADTISMDGWSLGNATTRSVIRDRSIAPGEYLILCPVADAAQYQAFGKTLGLSPWPLLNNSSGLVILKSFRNRTVDSVSYKSAWYKDMKKKQGGWSLERIGKFCEEWYNWGSSADASGGTPGEANSINKLGNKPEPLKIDSIQIVSDTTLRVHLSVIPDTLFLKPASFTLNARPAISLKPADNFLSIELTFDASFKEGVAYYLTAELRSCSGSPITYPDNRNTFAIPISPELDYPVIINELFADTSPVTGLPDSEFVELFNPTDQTVALKGLTYGDLQTSYTFSSGTIEPGGYLILCAAQDTASYKPFGKVHGLEPWPGLNNDKDVLMLQNNKGKEIHRTAYEASWHKTREKQLGGWSLELIDQNAACSGKQNWTSSINSSGGTPGTQNSVYQINTTKEPLRLLHAALTDSITLKLTFSRSIDSILAVSAKNYTINNGVGHPAGVSIEAPDFTQAILKFTHPLAPGITYNIFAENITDCAGGVAKSSAEFFIPEQITKGDILISEILFNPRKDGADFVEIYNNSSHELDLKELSITSVRDSLTGIKPVSILTRLIGPGEYVVLTVSPDNIMKEYTTGKPESFLKMQSLPSFNDNTGTVTLMSKGRLIDELTYNEKMHFRLIEDPEGISLERCSFSNAANEPGNFRSAASTAGYATPGYKNSQLSEEANSEKEVFLSSRTFSPDNDGFEDVLELNYTLNEAGWVSNISIYNDRGVLIKKLTQNQSLEARGTLYWDGFTEFNERAPVGIYVLYMEVFNLEGTVKKYKRSFAVAAKLN